MIGKGAICQCHPRVQTAIRSGFQSVQINTPAKEAEVEEKGKIYNSIPVNQNNVSDDKAIDDDDEWGAVPAFLRRSKLK